MAENQDDIKRKQDEINRLIQEEINLRIKLDELQKKASSGLSSYAEVLKTANQLQREVNKKKKLQEESEKRIERLAKKIDQIKKGTSKKGKEQLGELNNELNKEKAILNTLKQNNQLREKNVEAIKKEVNASNLVASTMKSSWRVGKGLLGTIWDTAKGMIDQIGAMKKTSMYMGTSAQQSKIIEKNIMSASYDAILLNGSVKELAKIQGQYSQESGRALALNKENLGALNSVAHATQLGAEGTASMAAEMEVFNISAMGVKDIILDSVNTAQSMGVNASKTIDNLQKNLKLANKYHFKGGVKSMTLMAAKSAKFRLNMQAISGFMDNVMDPEGAVEAASKLQVMGGEWAKLADPFKLMYEARNTPDKFLNSVITATKGMAQLNKETGEMEVNALQMSRFREIAKATNVPLEELVESSRAFNRQLEMKKSISGVISEEDRDFISGIADFDEKTKRFYVDFGDGKKFLNELSSVDKDKISQMREERKDLDDMIKESQTFDEKFANMMNSLKAALLPGLLKLNDWLAPRIDKLNNWLKNNNIHEEIAKWGVSIVDKAKDVVNYLVDTITSPGLWFKIGSNLALGFMAYKGIKGLLGGGAGGAGGAGRVMGKGPSRMSYVKSGFKNMKAGNFKTGFSRMGRGMKPSIGIGGATALGSIGLDIGRQFMEDPNSNFGKSIGVASSALEGAALGSMFTPIGAGIGALVGGISGAIREFAPKKEVSGGPAIGGAMAMRDTTSFDDFIMRPGEPPSSFNPNDTLIGAKPNGPIEKVLSNELQDKKQTSSTIKISPIKIEGSIKLNTDTNSRDINLDDPILMRELSRLIQIEVRKNINGGKFSATA